MASLLATSVNKPDQFDWILVELVLTLLRLARLDCRTRRLPAPRHQVEVDSDDEQSARPTPSTSSSSALTAQPAIPVYGQRQGWKPTRVSDFGDGGAYPECHVAQFPLEMGRANKTTAGNTLALQVDQDGNVKYDAIGKSSPRAWTTLGEPVEPQPLVYLDRLDTSSGRANT